MSSPLGILRDLPIEIRKTIYEFSFLDDTPKWLFWPYRTPGITRVSHHIRHETLRLYYQNQEWRITMETDLEDGRRKIIYKSMDTPEWRGVKYQLSHAFASISSGGTSISFNENSPLLRRFKVFEGYIPYKWNPFLTFVMRNGLPRIHHGCNCPLCGSWPARVLANLEEDLEIKESNSALFDQRREEHDAILRQLETLLFKDLNVSPQGFSIRTLNALPRRFRGTAVDLIKSDEERVVELYRRWKAIHVVPGHVQEWWRNYERYEGLNDGVVEFLAEGPDV